VRLAPEEPKKARLWGYGMATVAKLAGVHIEVVRRAIRLKRLQMDNLLAVSDWIRQRQLGGSARGLARLARVSRAVVDAAVRLGELDMQDPRSIEHWLAVRRKMSTKPSPSASFARFTLLRNGSSLRSGGSTPKSKRKPVWTEERARELVVSLRAIGFSAARRGKHHVFVRRDLYCLSDAQRLLDVMNEHGWRARQLSGSGVRWLAMFGGVALPTSLRSLTTPKTRELERQRGGAANT